jgi:hypothetical protein
MDLFTVHCSNSFAADDIVLSPPLSPFPPPSLTYYLCSNRPLRCRTNNISITELQLPFPSLSSRCRELVVEERFEPHTMEFDWNRRYVFPHMWCKRETFWREKTPASSNTNDAAHSALLKLHPFPPCLLSSPQPCPRHRQPPASPPPDPPTASAPHCRCCTSHCVSGRRTYSPYPTATRFTITGSRCTSCSTGREFVNYIDMHGATMDRTSHPSLLSK